MPYIGSQVGSSFSSRPATQEFNGDGSTTVFTLNQTVAQEDIVVSVDGVIQESVTHLQCQTVQTLHLQKLHQVAQGISL